MIASIKGFAQKCGNTVVSSGILCSTCSFRICGRCDRTAAGQRNVRIEFLEIQTPTLTGIVLIICVAKNPMAKYAKQIEEMKAK